MLHPDRDGDGPDAPALAFEVGQNPPSLPLLDGLDVELGQLVPPEGATDQERQDHVVALPFQGRAVGNGKQLLLLARGSANFPGEYLSDWRWGSRSGWPPPPGRSCRRAWPRPPACAPPRAGR